MITRKEYMAKKSTYEEYYEQFVTEGTKQRVLFHISLKELLASKDKHLNDIDLKRWDNIGIGNEVARTVCEANESSGYSLSDQVCINKEAARQLIAENI